MPQYVVGVIAAFGSPVFHGLSNILDNYLANNIFNRLALLVFMSSVTGLVLLPVVFFLDPPGLLTAPLLIVAFGIAAIEILYLYPYYWSLRTADTSIVASLFSFTRLFVPVLAFFLIGERLPTLQYAGLVLIVTASIFLTLDLRRLRFNPALFLMLFVGAILALEAVLVKYLFDHGVSWGTGVAWISIFEFLIALMIVLIPANLREVRVSLQKIKAFGAPFVLNEILGWAGNMTSYYAVFLIPVSVAKAIGSTQSAFVLLFALLLSKKYPHMLHEHTGRQSVRKKALLFACMIAGVSLVVFAGE